MPLRIVECLVKILRRHTDPHTSTTALPMMLPMVLYQGDEPWDHSTELLDLIDVDSMTAELAERFLPRFEFTLDDETEVNVEQLRRRPFTRQFRATVRDGATVKAGRRPLRVVDREIDHPDGAPGEIRARPPGQETQVHGLRRSPTHSPGRCARTWRCCSTTRSDCPAGRQRQLPHRRSGGASLR
jgi:hypothetical protein